MRGPGTTAEQIKALRSKLGVTGVEKATSIVADHNQDVVTLAYKLMRVNITKNKLPKSVTKLLKNMPDEEASKIRNQLVKASAKSVT